MRFVLICLLLCVLCIPVFAQDIPAPLQKVKEFCLASKPDVDGDYLLRFPGTWEGEDVEYVVGYFPRFEIVGIGLRNGNGSYIINFNEATGEFAVYSNGEMFPIEEELAIERAFKVFRGMVEGKII